MPEGVESDSVIQLEPEASSSKTVNVSKSKNSMFKVMINFDSKTPKIHILKRPEPKQQVLKNSESDVLKPKFKRKKTIVASWETKPKGIKPKVLSEQKPLNFKQKAQKKKSKTSSTNPKGPIKIWVPKSEIVNVVDMPKSKGRTQVMVPGQWFLTTYDKRKVYVPNPNNERGRNYRIWRQPDWQDYWHMNYW